MKMLLVSLVSVLFISGKYASRVDLQDNALHQSDGIRNIDNDVEVLENSVDQVQFNSENEQSEELSVKPIIRSKKSYYPFAPCGSCGFGENPYAHRPSTGYSHHTQHRPHFGFDNYNIHPKPAPYQAPQPVYSAPSYDVPNPHQPQYNPYNHNKYPVPAYPSPANFYPQPRPEHRVSSNLLIGCHPHVQPVPDFGYSSNYVSSPYAPPPPPPPPHHDPIAYRFNSHEESEMPRNIDKSSNELMPEKITLLDTSSSKTKPTSSSSKDHSDSQSVATTNNVDDKNETAKQADDFEEAKLKQHDTLFKMAKYQAQLAQRLATTDDKQKKEQLTAKNDQGKKV